MKSKVYKVNDKFKNILISLKTANIEIIKSDTSDIRLVYSECKGFTFSILVEDNTLKIKADKRKWYAYLLPSLKSQKIVIYVPREMLEDVTVKTVTGKIKIVDIVCTSLEVQNTTGKIELEKVIATSKIHIKSNTGRVYFNDSDANDIFVNSNTGSVRGVLLSEKSFIVKTKTGKINIPKTFSANRCQIFTNTGNINFEIKDKNQ